VKTSLPLGDITPELVLVLGAVVVLFYALFMPRRFQTGAAILSLAVVAATAVTTVVLLADPPGATFFDTYAADGAALWAKLVILAGTALSIALSVDWFRRDPRQGELYVLLLFAALGAVLMAGATDLMELIVGILMSSAAGFALAGFHRRSKPAAEAALKFFLIGGLANGGLLYGAALLFGLAGSTTFAGIAAASGRADALALAAGTTLVIVGLAFKLGAVPAHAWMPDVAEGSPAPSAAFLTAIPKVGAFVAIARLSLAVGHGSVGWRPLMALLAAVTMTVGNLAALWQDDVRRLLGWSAVSMTGYGLMAVVALDLSPLAIPSLLYFLVAYVFGNLAAFGVVVELRGRTDRQAYFGLTRTRPGLSAALAVAFLSFVGIPPLAGFVAKLALFAAAIDAGYTWLAVLAVVNTVISLVYYMRVVGPSYWEASPDLAPVPVLGRWAAIATFVSAGALIVTGVWAQPLMRAFDIAELLPR